MWQCPAETSINDYTASFDIFWGYIVHAHDRLYEMFIGIITKKERKVSS